MGKPQGRILALATGECGISAEDLKMGGPPVDNVAIDEEGSRTLMRLVTYSALVGFGLAYLCFRSFKVTFLIFFVGGVAAVTSLSLVWWTGGSVDAVLLSMPSLVYVLALSSAVHIVNYYREAAEENGLEGAPGAALRAAWRPCTLAAFTTALGLVSLYASNIVPIKKFGFYSAIGTMVALGLVFVFLPAALQMWPSPRRKTKPGDGGSDPNTTADTVHQWIQGFWERMGDWIVRRHWWVTGACTAVLIVFAIGLTRVNTSVKLLKLFDGDAKIIRDYEWMEANQGKLVPMEIVGRVRPPMILPSTSELVTAPNRDLAQERVQLNFLERMEISDRVYKTVEREFGEEGLDIVGRGMLASTFVEDLPGPSGSFRSTRGAFNGRLELHRDELLHSDYLRIDNRDDSELWRISLRLGALNDVDYGEFVGQLQRVVEPIMAAYRCRQDVLTSVEAQRDDASATAAVLVLGGPLPQVAQGATEASADTRNADTSSSTRNSLNETSIDQTAIFAESLRDLLINRGFLEPTAARPDPKRRLQWHVPERQPLSEAFPTNDALAAELARYDCVVLARDHADYDVEFLRQHARCWVDARDHQFDPHAQGALTANKRDDNVSVVYTGLVPIVYKAQRTLLNSLVNSIALAFIMISLVMMVLLRSGKLSPTNLINPSAGMVSMLPNVFPVVIIFGAMGYLDILVDVGTMMTASVAMGVAVDDTIHFLNWFRHGIAQGLDRRQAIRAAFRRVATAMTQTTLIGGLGLSVFALSTFTPTQRFGVMMLSLLAVALVGDLVFLPALLAGPLGKFFVPSERAKKKGDAGDKETPSSLELRPHTAIGTTHEGVPAPHGTPAPHHKAGRSRTAGDRAWRHDDGHGRRNQN
jgi:predicted RND superfamily exporter protein